MTQVNIDNERGGMARFLVSSSEIS